MAAEGGGSGSAVVAEFAAKAPEDVELEELEAAVAKQGNLVKTLKAEGKGKEDVAPEVLVLKELKGLLGQAKKVQGSARLAVDEKTLQMTALRRMFVLPSFEIYGGVGGLFDFGPPGTALKDALLALWRRHFVLEEDMLQLECTTLTPHAVLQTSGHVDKFVDLMVKDTSSGECFRADKLLEDAIERILSDPKAKHSKEEREELERVARQADAYSPEELFAQLQRVGADKSPTTGAPLTTPFPFNLMFETRIGPEGSNVGFLRPETAQSIFMNFRRMLDFNGGRLPFAGAQIGLAFRNEIAPRGGLLRVREFTMAEIEHFVDPADKSHPKFASVADDVLTLFPADRQLSDGKTDHVKIGQAVAKGVVANETLGYFMARTQRFLRAVGIQEKGLRFRQHLRTEMAHYATDCWDAEILLSSGWVECVGHADRACFDLQVHAKKTKVDLTASKRLEEPREEEYWHADLNRGKMGGTFRKRNKVVQAELAAYLENDEQAASAAAALASDGKFSLPIPPQEGDEGGEVEITSDMLTLSRKTRKVSSETILPSVIEPSFGIGRILWAILEHTFYARAEDEKRTVFAFPPVVAPTKLVILPLDQRIPRSTVAQVRREALDQGLSCSVDTSGVAIGRRYARADEIGAAFAVTVDFDTAEDKAVTLRERDSTAQLRVPLDAVASLVSDIVHGKTTFEKAKAAFPVVNEGIPLVGPAIGVHAAINATPDAAAGGGEEPPAA